MFLLVSKFKIIEMLLKVVHGQVQNSEQKNITKGFPTLPPLIFYASTEYNYQNPVKEIDLLFFDSSSL